MDAQTFTASVRVLRSYDYCHFEVQLGTNQAVTIDDVNKLRQTAAVLCDEAVRQYKIAKSKEAHRESDEWEIKRQLEELERIKAKPESELTPSEAAVLKASGEKEFWAKYHNDDYCYQEDPERDYHFSMLRKFKETVVKG